MYRKSIEEVLEITASSAKTGLSHQEAMKRLRRDGLNELKHGKKKNVVLIFFEQFKDPLVFILIIGALISVLLQEVLDACIILFVILMNAGIGTFQIMKSEKAMESLKKLMQPTCKVIRDGELMEINSNEVVVGDLLEFEAGDCIPCDLRLVKTTHLKMDESLLSGESESVGKNEFFVATSPLVAADQKNMAFMTTYVSNGHGRGIAVKCGMESEVGKIASYLNEDLDEMTPLKRRLQEMGKLLSALCLGLCIIMLVMAVVQGKDFFDMLILAISLAVAAIPEGLPAVVTIVQALGVQAMSKCQAIVRHLHAVETLGSVGIICSDKTGTLTENKMHVVTTYCDDVFDQKVSPEFLHVCALCNHVSFHEGVLIGDPGEIALIEFALNNGYDKQQLEVYYPLLDEIPFDSSRKMMSTLHQGKEKVLYTKGALDKILMKCDTIQLDGRVSVLTPLMKKKIMKANDLFASSAYRVLALAKKVVMQDSSEENLTFLGLVGLMDPIREEVKDAIQKSFHAGIDVAMITGDSPKTAYAIAKQLNLVKSEKQVMIGDEIEQCSDRDLRKKVKTVRVFARVTPQHKVRIVKAYKANGMIVAMCGDGVNDAPALKNAQIGIAMGKQGSDVCKGASDILLMDDNYTTIVKAIEAGRNIYYKIQRVVYYLLSCNLGEIMTLFMAVLLLSDQIAPLSAIQILWVNLVTDAFPALALGVEPDDGDVMEEKPRDPDESLFAHGGYFFTILNGMYIGTISLVAYKYGLQFSNQLAQTMAFMVLSLSQLFHALNCRNIGKSIFEIGVMKNRWLVMTFVVFLILQVMVCHFPIFNMLLKTQPLNLMQWIIVIGLSFSILLINEISKWIAHERK